MNKSYGELQSDLEFLQDAFDSEINSDMLPQIQTHINDVMADMDDYDLSQDDLFACDTCTCVSDIENSIKIMGVLVCEKCQTKAKE